MSQKIKKMKAIHQRTWSAKPNPKSRAVNSRKANRTHMTEVLPRAKCC
jgi:hypothetical protein